MATVTGTDTPIRDDARRDIVAHAWLLLTTTNDRGSKFQWPQGADRSVHVYGAEGTGGHVKMEGHNGAAPADDDSGWAVLDDTEGNAIDITTPPVLVNVGTLTRWIRPHVTAGNGSTSYNVILLARRR